MSDVPPPDDDRWRTRMLAIAALPLLVVAAGSAYTLWETIRAWADHPDLPRLTRPWLFHLTPIMVTAARTGLALAVLLAWWQRRQPARSRRIALGGYAIMLPLLIAPLLVPLGWSWDLPLEAQAAAHDIRRAAGPMLALGGVLDLLPLLPSVAVGLARAGMRRVHLHPGDATGALVAAVGALQMTLVAALVLAGLQPLLGISSAVLGLALLMLHYALATTVCLVHGRHGRATWKASRRLLTGSTLLLALPGLMLLLLGLWRAEFGGVHFVAIGEQPGLVPWVSAITHALEFAGRAIVTATVAYDLLVRALPPTPNCATAA